MATAPTPLFVPDVEGRKQTDESATNLLNFVSAEDTAAKYGNQFFRSFGASWPFLYVSQDSYHAREGVETKSW